MSVAPSLLHCIPVTLPVEKTHQLGGSLIFRLMNLFPLYVYLTIQLCIYLSLHFSIFISLFSIQISINFVHRRHVSRASLFYTYNIAIVFAPHWSPVSFTSAAVMHHFYLLLLCPSVDIFDMPNCRFFSNFRTTLGRYFLSFPNSLY